MGWGWGRARAGPGEGEGEGEARARARVMDHGADLALVSVAEPPAHAEAALCSPPASSTRSMQCFAVATDATAAWAAAERPTAMV